MVEEELETGRAFFRARRFSEAVASFSKVIEAQPNHFVALSNRSAALAQSKEYELALQDADRCIHLEPSNAKGYGRRGAALQGLCRYEEAAASFQMALTHDPSSEIYRQSLAEVSSLLACGRGIASQSTKEKYYFETSLKKGKEAMCNNVPLEAIRHFSKALSLCPESERHVLLTNRCAAYFKAGEYLLSEKDSQEAIKLAPSYARAYARLGWACLQQNRIEEAEQHFRVGLEKDRELVLAKEGLNEINKQRVPKVVENVAIAPSKSKFTAAPQVKTNANAHSTMYLHCQYCNEYGHTRRDCPLRVTKRTRDDLK